MSYLRTGAKPEVAITIGKCHHLPETMQQDNGGAGCSSSSGSQGLQLLIGLLSNVTKTLISETQHWGDRNGTVPQKPGSRCLVCKRTRMQDGSTFRDQGFSRLQQQVTIYRGKEAHGLAEGVGRVSSVRGPGVRPAFLHP